MRAIYLAIAGIGAAIATTAPAQDRWESPISINHAGGFAPPLTIPVAVGSSRRAGHDPGGYPGIGPAGPINPGQGYGDDDPNSVPLPGPAAMGLGGIALLSMRRRRTGH